ncbi:MAG: hypothetical protein CMJ74_05170 [Planctomycetaceae bacterium]|nr:hypothetical protein [Planctomycetaceae bacterium]
MEKEHAASLKVKMVSVEDRASVARVCGIEQHVSSTDQIEYLEACEAEQAVGYLALVWSAGGNAWLRGPKIMRHGSVSASKIARALLNQADHLFELKNIKLAQVMLSPTQDHKASWYAECGYDTQIALELLTRPLVKDRPSAPEPELSPADANCHSIGYAPQFHARFSQVLAASYVDSSDCLAMRRHSDPEMALADFRDVPDFDPTLWRLFGSNREDFGCLLLHHHPDEASLEIAYLGFKPPFRRCGWGHRAMATVLSIAKRLDCQRVTVGVDIRNNPARRLYARWGFWCFSRQQVLIRTASAEF